jgi:hypothetical protein
MPKEKSTTDQWVTDSDDVSEMEFRANANEIFTILAERENVSDDTILLAAMLQLLVSATSRQTEMMEFILGSSEATSISMFWPPRSH